MYGFLYKILHIQINVYEFIYTNSYIQNCIKRVMLVVLLLNSSICYFSFSLFMCFFRFLERKRILHRYGNADMALFKSMNSSNLTHFSLSPKICSHWSSKQCQLGFSGIMSVAVSSMSHFHSSATSSPADGACDGIC
jgi:hypothetical protein